MDAPELAFPVKHEDSRVTFGMTLREYAAVHALVGILVSADRGATLDAIAGDAVRSADALIAELAK